MRPDKLGPAIHDYIANLLGEQFTEEMRLSLPDLYKESDPQTPVLIVGGKERGPQIREYALSVRKKFEYIEMGTVEADKFESAIEDASKSGKWVILNQLHLAYDIQTQIRRSLRFLANPHRNFKLWISTASVALLPTELYDQSLRFFVSPPNSLK